MLWPWVIGPYHDQGEALKVAGELERHAKEGVHVVPLIDRDAASVVFDAMEPPD